MPIDPIETLTYTQQPANQSLDVQQENQPVNDEKLKIEKACHDFESLFVMQMMKQMRKTVPQDGLFSGGNAEKMYSSMLDGEIAKTVSEQRGIGLAPALMRQLLELSGNEKNRP